MKTIDDIKNTIHKYKAYLSDKFKVKSISIWLIFERGAEGKQRFRLIG